GRPPLPLDTESPTATEAEGGGGPASSGPVHVNLAFRHPLSGTAPELAALIASAHECVEAARGNTGLSKSPATTGRPEVTLAQNKRSIVIAGAGAGEAAEEFARQADWPLVAEVVSGARFGPNLVQYYREMLDDADFGGRVERAVVFGHPTL